MMEVKPANSGIFNSALHAARIGAGMSITDLAARAGLARATVHELEHRRRPAQLLTAAALAAALGKGLEELFRPVED